MSIATVTAPTRRRIAPTRTMPRRLVRRTWHTLRTRLSRRQRVIAIECGSCGQWTRPRRYNPRTGLCRTCATTLAVAYRTALFPPRRPTPADTTTH